MRILSKEERELLLKIARLTLEQFIRERKRPEFDIPSPNLNQPGMAFVSLHEKEDLRGCIGAIEPVKPLWQCIRDMTIESSTSDPRFPPVSKKELEEIDIEISVLTPFKKISSINEIEIGRDGLYIKHGFFSGLLLPQVAVDWKWNKDQFLSHACMKAGLESDAWKKQDIEIFTFQAQIFSIRPPQKILFVCHDNSIKSIIASEISNKLLWLFYPYSAGISPTKHFHSLTIKLLEEKGIKLKDKNPKGIKDLPVKKFDKIIVFDEEAISGVSFAQKINWNIEDPEETMAGFRELYNTIESNLHELADNLKTDMIHFGRT